MASGCLEQNLPTALKQKLTDKSTTIGKIICLKIYLEQRSAHLQLLSGGAFAVPDADLHVAGLLGGRGCPGNLVIAHPQVWLYKQVALAPTCGVALQLDALVVHLNAWPLTPDCCVIECRTLRLGWCLQVQLS